MQSQGWGERAAVEFVVLIGAHAMARKSDDKKAASPAGRKTSGRSRTEHKDVLASFPVVGIVASAGGVAVVTQLLNHLRVGIGIAVVVIQHLDPKHGSLAADILSRSCRMPVAEIQHGVQIEAGRVYVIPPNIILR